MSSGRTYNVILRSYSEDAAEIELLFAKKDEQTNQEGATFLKLLLGIMYPLVFSQQEISIKEDRNAGGFLVAIKGKAQIFCATHLLTTQPIFEQYHLLIDGENKPMNKGYDYVYLRLGKKIRNEIITQQHPSPLDVILKSIIRELLAGFYQPLKNRLVQLFREKKVIFPQFLSQLMTELDKINDIDLEFLTPKYMLLLAYICIHKNLLEVNSLKNKNKIIKIYDTVLTEQGYSTEDQRNNLLAEYHKNLPIIQNGLQALAKEQAKLPMWESSVDVKNLREKINIMRAYGEALQNEKIAKGDIVCDLAGNLETLAKAFFSQGDEQIAKGFQQFKIDFSRELNSKNKLLSEYRIAWSTIIKNIAMALTGIGAFIIAGKLIHAKWTEGRALLLFSRKNTTSEQRCDAINQAMNLVQVTPR